MAAVVAAVGFLLAWPIYGELYRHGDDRPLPVEDATAQVDSPRFLKAETRVFEDGLEASRYLSANGSRSVMLELSSWTYLLIAAGPRSSTGYRLRVGRAVEERGRVVIEAREETPGVHDLVEPRVTYPFLLLQVPAGHKPVRVELEGRP